MYNNIYANVMTRRIDMDNRNRPIGFFDSGVGGLSVLKYALQELPNEDFLFYGDCANVPYGEKTAEEVRDLTISCCDLLYKKGAKALLIACNTATSAAIYAMREKYQMPVISMEPAIKPAILSEKPGKVLVMATPGTLSSQRYARLVQKVGHEQRLISVPCGGLADLLEQGEFNSEEIKSYIRKKVEPYRGQEISGIVIGCTHYSFISDQIQKIAKELLYGACDIYDGMYGTVRHLKNLLFEYNLDKRTPGGNVELFASGEPRHLEIMKKILKYN